MGSSHSRMRQWVIVIRRGWCSTLLEHGHLFDDIAYPADHRGVGLRHCHIALGGGLGALLVLVALVLVAGHLRVDLSGTMFVWL